MKAWMSGNVAGTGTFRCTDCDYPVSLDAADELPTCPNCGGTRVHPRLAVHDRADDACVELPAEVEDQELARRGSRGRERARAVPRLPQRQGDDRDRVRARSASGPGSAAASPPTSASTTRPCRAATR